jgi:arylsulfatase
MGFSDLSCYGSEIPTPNIDALAANGLRFTQFYNTGRCCPTRAALLTGLYSHQTGVGLMVENQKLPGYVGHLNDSCVTLAEVLKPAGYFTAMSGKWHVGQSQGVTPLKRGFDRCLNAPAGGFYFWNAPRAEIYLDDVKLANDDPRLPKDWYSTDLWTTFGLKFIDDALAAKKPFYLHLCHNAPHFPLQAPKEEIEKFLGQYKIGWEEVRARRYARQLEMGLIDRQWISSPLPNSIKAWKEIPAEEQARFDHLMATYAAVVHHMDQAVGDLVAGLKQRGVLNNTLILFMSDNGGNAETGASGRTEGDPSTGKSQWYCGESWAYAENTPFRLYKHFNHEGGIATPLIVHWPDGIVAKNEFRRQQGHVIDVMPTLLELTGATYPKEFGGKPILPMEGCSLVPAFSDKPIERQALYWEHEGNAAVRVGDLKLVRRGRKGPWELYDMKVDRTELHDLTQSQPDKAQELTALWNTWAERTHVLPAPRGQGDKKATNK